MEEINFTFIDVLAHPEFPDDPQKAVLDISLIISVKAEKAFRSEEVDLPSGDQDPQRAAFSRKASCVITHEDSSSHVIFENLPPHMQNPAALFDYGAQILIDAGYPNVKFRTQKPVKNGRHA
jgi:hypothetical protein